MKDLMTKEEKKLQVKKCIQLIREVQNQRVYSRSLGDDISDALDNLDTQLERKLLGYAEYDFVSK